MEGGKGNNRDCESKRPWEGLSAKFSAEGIQVVDNQME
jgi:hypothetical protein